LSTNLLRIPDFPYPSNPRIPGSPYAPHQAGFDLFYDSPSHNKPEDDGKDNHTTDSHHDSDLRGDKFGRIFLFESLRADNVPQTEGHKQDCIHGDPLGVSGVIGSDPLVKQWEGGTDEVGEVVAAQFTCLCIVRKESHKAATEDTRDE
jgi:hypothetical protein